MQELQGGNNIGDWYFLKNCIIIKRYGYFENPILLPKFVTPKLYSLEMGRKMCAIETKYGSRGNFKLSIKMPATTTNITLIEIGCKDELANFIVQNFKLDSVDAPWMYDPTSDIKKIIKSNKKCPKFSHEA